MALERPGHRAKSASERVRPPSENARPPHPAARKASCLNPLTPLKTPEHPKSTIPSGNPVRGRTRATPEPEESQTLLTVKKASVSRDSGPVTKRPRFLSARSPHVTPSAPSHHPVMPSTAGRRVGKPPQEGSRLAMRNQNQLSRLKANVSSFVVRDILPHITAKDDIILLQEALARFKEAEGIPDAHIFFNELLSRATEASSAQVLRAETELVRLGDDDLARKTLHARTEANLRSRIEDASTKATELAAESRSARAERQAIVARCDELSTRLTQAQSELASIDKAVSSAQDSRDQLRPELFGALCVQVETAQAAVAQVEEQVIEWDNAIVRAKRDLAIHCADALTTSRNNQSKGRQASNSSETTGPAPGICDALLAPTLAIRGPLTTPLGDVSLTLKAPSGIDWCPVEENERHLAESSQREANENEGSRTELNDWSWSEVIKHHVNTGMPGTDGHQALAESGWEVIKQWDRPHILMDMCYPDVVTRVTRALAAYEAPETPEVPSLKDRLREALNAKDLHGSQPRNDPMSTFQLDLLRGLHTTLALIPRALDLGGIRQLDCGAKHGHPKSIVSGSTPQRRRKSVSIMPCHMILGSSDGLAPHVFFGNLLPRHVRASVQPSHGLWGEDRISPPVDQTSLGLRGLLQDFIAPESSDTAAHAVSEAEFVTFYHRLMPGLTTSDHSVSSSKPASSPRSQRVIGASEPGHSENDPLSGVADLEHLLQTFGLSQDDGLKGMSSQTQKLYASPRMAPSPSSAPPPQPTSEGPEKRESLIPRVPEDTEVDSDAFCICESNRGEAEGALRSLLRGIRPESTWACGSTSGNANSSTIEVSRMERCASLTCFAVLSDERRVPLAAIGLILGSRSSNVPSPKGLEPLIQRLTSSTLRDVPVVIRPVYLCQDNDLWAPNNITVALVNDRP